MEFYTADSMNLVLGDVTGTLGVSPDEGSWLLTVYSASLFFGVPLSVWLAGHVGYKRFLIASVLLFAASSVGCALSPGYGILLAFRALQGLAGGGLVVWWRAGIYVIFPKSQRSASLMLVSTMLYLSSALGLILSGVITEEYDWRLLFLPNLAFAAIAVWLLARYFPDVPKSTAARTLKVDWPGIFFLAVSLIALQIVLNRGEVDGWWDDEAIRWLVWASIVSILAFVVWQTCPLNDAPLIWLPILRDRRVLSAIPIGVCTGMILSGSLFVLPEFLRNLSRITHSASQTGQLICVYALTAAAVRYAIPGIVARFGQRMVIAAALLLLIASMVLFQRCLTTGTPDGYFIAPLMLYGLCLSPLLPSVGSGTVARVEGPNVLDAVSVYMTFRTLGASLGVAILSILLVHRETLHSSRIYESLGARGAAAPWLSSAAQLLVARGESGAPDAMHGATAILARAATRQAAALSYADTFTFMAGVGVIGLGFIFFIPPTPPARGK
jgi:DHA2 family multidrug resistance protein